MTLFMFIHKQLVTFPTSDIRMYIYQNLRCMIIFRIKPFKEMPSLIKFRLWSVFS